MSFVENPILDRPKTPFKYRLVQTNYYSEKQEIKTIRNFPGKFVRLSIGFFVSTPFENPKEDITGTQYEYLENKKILMKLKNKYHIPVPDFDIVIGPGNEYQVIYYTVVDRIYGRNLRKQEFKSKEKSKIKEQADSLYSSITQYLWDSYANGGWYMGDLARDTTQFVYGRKREENERKIYLVDIEPWLFYLDTNDPRTHIDLFISAFTSLYQMIEETELKLGKKLERSRAKLLDFANSIPEPHEYFSFVQEAKEKLEGR